MIIKTKCKSCGGTGLYRGLVEGNGVAVVCWSCGGLGYREEEYQEPDLNLKVRQDTLVVVRDCFGYRFPSDDVVEFGFPHVTYKEFLNGELPRKPTQEEIQRFSSWLDKKYKND